MHRTLTQSLFLLILISILGIDAIILVLGLFLLYQTVLVLKRHYAADIAGVTSKKEVRKDRTNKKLIKASRKNLALKKGQRTPGSVTSDSDQRNDKDSHITGTRLRPKTKSTVPKTETRNNINGTLPSADGKKHGAKFSEEKNQSNANIPASTQSTGHEQEQKLEEKAQKKIAGLESDSHSRKPHTKQETKAVAVAKASGCLPENKTGGSVGTATLCNGYPVPDDELGSLPNPQISVHKINSSGELADASSTGNDVSWTIQKKQRKKNRRRRHSDHGKNATIPAQTGTKLQLIDVKKGESGFLEFTIDPSGGIVKLPFVRLKFVRNAVVRPTNVTVKAVQEYHRKGQGKIIFLSPAIHFGPCELLERPIKFSEQVEFSIVPSKQVCDGNSDAAVVVQKAEGVSEWKTLETVKYRCGKYVSFRSDTLCWFRIITMANSVDVLWRLYCIVTIARPTGIEDPAEHNVFVSFSNNPFPNNTALERLLPNHFIIHARPGSELLIKMKGDGASCCCQDEPYTFVVPDLERKGAETKMLKRRSRSRKDNSEMLFSDDFSFRLQKLEGHDTDKMAKVECKITGSSRHMDTAKSIYFRWLKKCEDTTINVQDGGIGQSNIFINFDPKQNLRNQVEEIEHITDKITPFLSPQQHAEVQATLRANGLTTKGQNLRGAVMCPGIISTSSSANDDLTSVHSSSCTEDGFDTEVTLGEESAVLPSSLAAAC